MHDSVPDVDDDQPEVCLTHQRLVYTPDRALIENEESGCVHKNNSVQQRGNNGGDTTSR